MKLFRIKQLVSERVLPRVIHIIQSETFSETLGEIFGESLGEIFALAKRLAESLALDYIHNSWQDSLRDTFFFTRRFLDYSEYSDIIIRKNFFTKT